MSRLHTYLIFHANLKYSSVPMEHYPLILDRCYWPLLEMAMTEHLKIGIEFSAFTLERIDREDGTFVKTLRQCWEQGIVDVIGSGYIQAAFPTIPVEVNARNLAIGNDIYRSLLGRCPIIAYLNEQIYSSGLVQIYREAGYDVIVMDWDNSAGHPQTEKVSLYRPQGVLGCEGKTLRLLWNSSILFQKFQHCVWGELTIQEFAASLMKHRSPDEERALPIYGSDLEIFDYKPHRSEHFHFQHKANDFLRIRGMLRYVKDMQNVLLSTPSEILEAFPSQTKVQIETSEIPIPCKKQERYNITRWSVCGRDNVKKNTQCYRLLKRIKQLEWLVNLWGCQKKKEVELEKVWKKLCFLWASDFRTFTTDEKHTLFNNVMGETFGEVNAMIRAIFAEHSSHGEKSPLFFFSEPHRGDAFLERYRFPPGAVHVPFRLEYQGDEVPYSVDRVSCYRDGSVRSADVFVSIAEATEKTGALTFESGAGDRSSHEVLIDAQRGVVQTPAVRVRLSERKGATISSLAFPSIAENDLIFRLPHGFFGSIRQSDGAYSGDTLIYDRSGLVVNDLQPTALLFPDRVDACDLYIPVRAKVCTPLGDFWKTYRVFIEEPRLDLVYQFQLKPLSPFYFRVGSFVINPHSFNRSSLYYATVNGGYGIERFDLAGRQVIHDRPVDLTVSTHNSLGATEGWVTVGDDEKAVSIVTDKALLYSAPLIRYEEFNDIFFLKISHSIGESDETAHSFWQGHNQAVFSILAHKNQHDLLRRKSRLINHPPGTLLGIQEEFI